MSSSKGDQSFDCYLASTSYMGHIDRHFPFTISSCAITWEMFYLLVFLMNLMGFALIDFSIGMGGGILLLSLCYF